MSRSRVIILILSVAVVVVAARLLLDRGNSSSSRAGQVVMEWRGSRTGRVMLPGTLAWCPINRVGTLEAINNDTGLMITILELDSLSRGPHHVVTTETREASPRPSAVAAMRWVSDSGNLVGFRSMSGVVDLQPAGERASGAFEIRLRAAVGSDTLVVRGDFRDIAVTIGAVGCS